MPDSFEGLHIFKIVLKSRKIQCQKHEVIIGPCTTLAHKAKPERVGRVPGRIRDSFI